MSIGTIISGSLSEGFVMRVHSHVNLEDIKAGKFVSIIGRHHIFFSLITDLALEVTHPDILLFPPERHELLLQDAVKSHGTYATARLKPLLMLSDDGKIMPVKTIPCHFADVCQAHEKDIATIFGDEREPSKKYFSIGHPLDMRASVCIDLEKLTERSNGIFGKTGTGKTFLTRLVLAGLIKQERAVNLIFDMHGEYGVQARKEGGANHFVKGLKTLFDDKVAIFSLDPQSTRRRGGSPDVEIILDYRSIQVEDVLSLQEELALHPTACEAAYLIAAKYKRDWLMILLKNGDTLKELALEVGAHSESIAALYRKLKVIERLPFFSSDLSAKENVIDRMLEYINNGISIVVEFGNFTSTFCYLLLANIITRRIHALYIQKTEKFLGTRAPQDEPKKLMITIEEAHKFLNPQTARQTIFGTIAREMRKYYVSLLVIDQRPSGIDPEIMSQIGTKIVAQLHDEKDIQAVLNGVGNAHYLRSILASLESKKQAMLLGHAVMMPIVIETRNYDEQFYQAMQGFAHKNINEIISEIF